MKARILHMPPQALPTVIELGEVAEKLTRVPSHQLASLKVELVETGEIISGRSAIRHVALQLLEISHQLLRAECAKTQKDNVKEKP